MEYEAIKKPLRRDEIATKSTHSHLSVVMGGSVRGFDKVLGEANAKLRRTAGLELVPLPPPREIQLRASELTAAGLANRRKRAVAASAGPAGSSYSYVLVVAEEMIEESADVFYHSDPEHLGLLLSVLVAVTLASDSPMNHADLCQWVAKIMDVEDVQEFQPLLAESISDWLDTLCKQRYLHRERISLADDDASSTQTIQSGHPWAYGVGPRAELEFPTSSMKVFCQKLAAQGDQDADRIEDLHRRIEVTFSRFSKQKAIE